MAFFLALEALHWASSSFPGFGLIGALSGHVPFSLALEALDGSSVGFSGFGFVGALSGHVAFSLAFEALHGASLLLLPEPVFPEASTVPVSFFVVPSLELLLSIIVLEDRLGPGAIRSLGRSDADALLSHLGPVEGVDGFLGFAGSLVGDVGDGEAVVLSLDVDVLYDTALVEKFLEFGFLNFGGQEADVDLVGLIASVWEVVGF